MHRASAARIAVALCAIPFALLALAGASTNAAHVVHAPQLLWGANIGPQLTGQEAPWDMSAVSALDRIVHERISVVHFGSPFTDCSSSPCTFYPFPARAMGAVRAFGAIPFLSWSSLSAQTPAGDGRFGLSSIISGKYDSYIRRFALGAKRWRHPFFLRFDWEMNGNWYPWSEGVNGNKPGQFVHAWRHVHDIFTAVGARNASWVWCPNVDPTHEWTNLRELYPGDSSVDWTCLDGYNWGTNPAGPRGWMSFDRLFKSTYHEIVGKIAPAKPMIIGEVASTEQGGSKAAWIANMLSALPKRYPQVRGVLWYERYDSGMDWPLESSGSAVSAFARGIGAPAYRGNSYTRLGASPIPPPSGPGQRLHH